MTPFTGATETSVAQTHSTSSGDRLVDWSPKDRPWDQHRSQAQDLEAVYREHADTQRHADRVANCSTSLVFAKVPDDTGEVTLRLRHALFCRVRHCPVCQWRRSLMWKARFYEALPAITAEYPLAKWIFLTLTVKNCRVDQLRETLQQMNKGWKRLTMRKEFEPVLGWIRATEVTRGKDGSAHPHFHCLLLVKPSMIAGKRYVPQAKWVELWQSVAGLDYKPIVHVQAVKDKRGRGPEEAVKEAAAEVLKYAVKPQDMVEDTSWYHELHHQVHRMRFIATGGVLKNVLRTNKETNEELIYADQEKEAALDGPRIAFAWHRVERHYKLSKLQRPKPE